MALVVLDLNVHPHQWNVHTPRMLSRIMGVREPSGSSSLVEPIWLSVLELAPPTMAVTDSRSGSIVIELHWLPIMAIIATKASEDQTPRTAMINLAVIAVGSSTSIWPAQRGTDHPEEETFYTTTFQYANIIGLLANACFFICAILPLCSFFPLCHLSGFDEVRLQVR